MTNEQKAALERLRVASESNEACVSVYGEDWVTSKDVQRDAAVVVYLALAEHPADDDEPVTVEWFVKCGAKVENRPEGWVAVFEPAWHAHTSLFIYWDGTVIAKNMGHEARLNEVETRGDVLRLCRALGIPLNE